MSRWMSYASCVAVLLAGSPAAVSAQPDQAFRQSAPVRLGPLYLAPVMTLKELGVDTNVFNSAGAEESDFFFSVSPQTEFWLPVGRRLLVTGSAAGDAVFFQHFATERSIDPRGQMRAEVYVSRMTLFGTGSFLRSRQRPNFEIDVRTPRVERSAGAGVNIRLLRKISLEVATQLSRVEFEGDALFFGTSLREMLNREGRAASASLRYQVTPLTTIVVRGEAIDDRFKFSPARNARSESVAPGLEFRAGALITGAVSVGVRRFRPLDDRVPDFQGTTASADLSYALLGSTMFRFTADRDVAYSFEPSQPYYLRSGYGGSVSRPLAGSFDATIGAQRYTYSYREFADADPASLRADVTRVLSAMIGYRVSSKNRFGVTGSYVTRESNRGARGYNSMRIGASATYAF